MKKNCSNSYSNTLVQYCLTKSTRWIGISNLSQTYWASIQSCSLEQNPVSSIRSQFFRKTPCTSNPADFHSDDSTQILIISFLFECFFGWTHLFASVNKWQQQNPHHPKHQQQLSVSSQSINLKHDHFVWYQFQN